MAAGFGWTVGGGLKLAATNNTSVKFEYVFIDAPAMTMTWPSGVTSNSFEVRDSIARVGVNVRFQCIDAQSTHQAIAQCLQGDPYG
jgi:opacity protein-like surface antigen